MGQTKHCAKCGKEIVGERHHINGRDFCSQCGPTIPRSPCPGPWTETVRGYVIGGDDGLTQYAFWQNGRKVAEVRKATDKQAVAWFKENFPAKFAQGAEMRAYDI